MSKAEGKPPHQDPAQPAFWDKRFGEGVTPWDAGGVPAALAEFLKTLPAGQRVLIPGCGSGHEVRAFADAGHEVLAIDFSEAAIEAARRTLGDYARRVRLGDFFRFDAGRPFDLVYERAFLCALPRATWPRYGPRITELLRPGGLLAGFFFWNDEPRGPPFGPQAGQLDTLLAPRFERAADEPVHDSIPAFAGKERWQVWRRPDN